MTCNHSSLSRDSHLPKKSLVKNPKAMTAGGNSNRWGRQRIATSWRQAGLMRTSRGSEWQVDGWKGLSLIGFALFCFYLFILLCFCHDLRVVSTCFKMFCVSVVLGFEWLDDGFSSSVSDISAFCGTSASLLFALFVVGGSRGWFVKPSCLYRGFGRKVPLRWKLCGLVAGGSRRSVTVLLAMGLLWAGLV